VKVISRTSAQGEFGGDFRTEELYPQIHAEKD
jgi:hypothetical protein